MKYIFALILMFIPMVLSAMPGPDPVPAVMSAHALDVVTLKAGLITAEIKAGTCSVCHTDKAGRRSGALSGNSGVSDKVEAGTVPDNQAASTLPALYIAFVKLDYPPGWRLISKIA